VKFDKLERNGGADPAIDGFHLIEYLIGLGIDAEGLHIPVDRMNLMLITSQLIRSRSGKVGESSQSV
jgi:hypothetical protein